MPGEKILVIDDSPTILKVVQLVLTRAGFDVRTALDGDEGVSLAKQQRPDLILLDFIMPKMNGYHVCRALQEEPTLKDVPVVLMSAKGEQIGDRFVKVMGVVDYITKPFSPEAITSVVQHILTKIKDSASEQPPTLLPVATPEEMSAAADKSVENRRHSLEQLQNRIAGYVSTAITSKLAQKSMVVDEAQIGQWISESLTTPSLELLLGELRATAPELLGAPEVALAGDLHIVPLAEILFLLGEQEQTGVLTVTRVNAQVELHFRDGRIQLCTAVGLSDELMLGRFIVENRLLSREELEQFISERSPSAGLLGAQLVKQGKITTEQLKEVMHKQSCELVYEMMRWSSGKFSFRATTDLAPIAADAELALSIDSILMEGFRRVDEWHLIEREIDDFELVFLRNDDAVNQMGRGRLTREELAILELVNGKNTVKDIIRNSRMGSFDVTKMLYRLLSIKLIRKRVQPVAV